MTAMPMGAEFDGAAEAVQESEWTISYIVPMMEFDVCHDRN